MENAEIAIKLKRLMKRQLSNVNDALRRDDVKAARSELADAMSKLKKLIKAL